MAQAQQPFDFHTDVEFVDTQEGLETFLYEVSLSPLRGPIFIELQGTCTLGPEFGRRGTISLMTVLLPQLGGEPKIYILDIDDLGDDSFDYQSGTPSLRRVLESNAYLKVFFDVYYAANVLYWRHNIQLAHVEDLQLLELGSKTEPKLMASSLARCIEKDAPIEQGVKEQWARDNSAIVRRNRNQSGAGVRALYHRPLNRAIITYCAQNVFHLPALRTLYRNRLQPIWVQEVDECTLLRVGAPGWWTPEMEAELVRRLATWTTGQPPAQTAPQPPALPTQPPAQTTQPTQPPAPSMLPPA